MMRVGEPLEIFSVWCCLTTMSWIFTVYVDATDTCNKLTFQLGAAGVGTTVAARAWSLKVPGVLNCDKLKNLFYSFRVQQYYRTRF